MINILNINRVEKNYGTTTAFQNYKVIYDNGKILNVPLDEANTDYQAIQEWIANGGQVIDNGA